MKKKLSPIEKLLEAYDYGQFATDMPHLDSMPEWLRTILREALVDIQAIYNVLKR